MLALTDDQRADADASAVAQRIAQQRVTLPTGAVRLQPVRAVEVREVDVTGGDEVLDVDRLRGGRPGLVEVRVRHHDELALLVLVALGDVAPLDLDVLRAAIAPVVDGGGVRLVDLSEPDFRLTLGRRMEAHRDRHEPESDRTLPHRPGHVSSEAQSPCHRGPPGEGGYSAMTSRERPAVFAR